MEGLRKKHPESEIHMLINKQFACVEFLFEGLVDRFIYFDRESLQKSCGEKEYNIFWGYHQLKLLVEDLNRTPYDSLYNFTHTRMTAHLMGLIRADQRIGIYSFAGQFYGLNNPWIQFFNNYFGRSEAAGFHYTELLGRALRIPLSQKLVKWPRSSVRKTVLIQALTSDTKKNWGLAKIHSLVQALEKETLLSVKVLGAPFEREILDKVFTDKNLYICDLQEAARALKECALLITGDTSIKHLGALYEVPILELALGSSQPLQVGAYSNSSVILQTRVPCGPCSPSIKCSQQTHHCGETLSIVAVFEAAKILLGMKPPDWRSFVNQNPELNVLRTEIQDAMGWSLQCLSFAERNKFDEVIQKKTMIIQELDRQLQLSLAVNPATGKGEPYEQRVGKLSVPSAEAS
ncbi:MAG: glycosyltransferase family 9 protein [Pseudobdellovibrionaceae bacterium]